ncbi:hypothetical protein [Roseospira navarrensis]|uniref:Uncharacterized protein n=1 Tax=Roseospira navarrensis TaxID=140058 RepID=A0A7X1ZE01_9PROT|nr:hypothetical protein [Roseospira navarrensis]MQX36603.1 hypothetical protein [Roseospira navarrensis]
MADVKVGNIVEFGGNVTTLLSIKPGAERDMEKALGYAEGRLSKGYFVLLLRQLPAHDDFKLAGYSYFSGGRIGKPRMVAEKDTLREHLQEKVLREHGLDGVLHRKRIAREGMSVTGRHRIAKVLPVIRHDSSKPPAQQYPVGGGVPQFELTRPRKFLVALEVTADGTAIARDFEVNVKTGGYEARRRLRVYMENA